MALASAAVAVAAFAAPAQATVDLGNVAYFYYAVVNDWDLRLDGKYDTAKDRDYQWDVLTKFSSGYQQLDLWGVYSTEFSSPKHPAVTATFSLFAPDGGEVPQMPAPMQMENGTYRLVMHLDPTGGDVAGRVSSHSHFNISPAPAALPLLATGLAGVGALAGFRRRPPAVEATIHCG